MFNVRLAGDKLYGKMAVHLAVAGPVFGSLVVFCFVLSFFPREIWD